MTQQVGNSRIQLIKGTLFSDPPDSDCLVNSANPLLKHDEGLTKMFAKHFGKIFLTHCMNYINKFGLLPPGQIFTCPSDQLTPYIINTVGVHYEVISSIQYI